MKASRHKGNSKRIYSARSLSPGNSRTTGTTKKKKLLMEKTNEVNASRQKTNQELQGKPAGKLLA